LGTHRPHNRPIFERKLSPLKVTEEMAAKLERVVAANPETTISTHRRAALAEYLQTFTDEGVPLTAMRRASLPQSSSAQVA
jgi:hypothetical protein